MVSNKKVVTMNYLGIPSKVVIHNDGGDEGLAQPGGQHHQSVLEKAAPGDGILIGALRICLLYTSPSPRDRQKSRMPSSA